MSKRNLEEFDIELMPKGQDESDFRIKVDEVKTKIYNIYMHESVEMSDTYLEFYEVFRKATKDDVINLYMNSYGGYLDTAVSFSGIMQRCEAKIVGYLDVACSAMGMIALHCDEIILNPNSYFQAHNFKGGSAGTGREMRDKQKFDDKYFPALVKRVYNGFLTEEEMDELPNDANHWLTADEIAVKLKKIGKLSKQGYQGNDDIKEEDEGLDEHN